MIRITRVARNGGDKILAETRIGVPLQDGVTDDELMLVEFCHGACALRAE